MADETPWQQIVTKLRAAHVREDDPLYQAFFALYEVIDHHLTFMQADAMRRSELSTRMEALCRQMSLRSGLPFSKPASWWRRPGWHIVLGAVLLSVGLTSAVAATMYAYSSTRELGMAVLEVCSHRESFSGNVCIARIPVGQQ